MFHFLGGLWTRHSKIGWGTSQFSDQATCAARSKFETVSGSVDPSHLTLSRLRLHSRHQAAPEPAPRGPKNRASILLDRRLALDDLPLMLDRHPQFGQPAPDPLGQIERVARPFLLPHLTEPVLKRSRHVDLLPVAPLVGLPVHQSTERRFGFRRIMFGVGSVNGLACPWTA